MSSTLPAYFLPNLPGFKPRDQPSGIKTHYFSKVEGIIFMKNDQANPIGEEGSVSTFNSSAVMTSRFDKKSIDNMNITLTYFAYFEESANDPSNPTAMNRIRKCNIYFFLEDNTMTIMEKPQENSGIAQGKLVKRGVALKPNGTPYTVDDFAIGESITIYCRTYHIVDCDDATRKFLRRFHNREEAPGIPIPDDPYQEIRQRSQHPGFQSDRFDRFHSKKNPNKKFMEAQLGNTVTNEGRLGFMKYGNQTLKFHCVWDDTRNLYGDKMEYSLVYHLSDDSIEINSMNASKGEQFSRLLKRSKLPRNMKSLELGVSDNPVDTTNSDQFYHFSDFYIGMSLNVYARTLIIVDVDRFTRQFYEEIGSPLALPIESEAPEVTISTREIPAYTGFGSEEDSMRSCTGSLLPGPAPVKKLGENKVLSFFASLLSGGPDDADRKFVVQYYVVDNTLKIQEPPVRNSGFVGGVFLSRRQVKGPDGTYISDKDLYIGCKLKVLQHSFYLTASNASTLQWMESKKLPRANYYAILDKMRPTLLKHAVSGELKLQFQELGGPEAKRGFATVDTLRKVLDMANLLGNESNKISEHEMVTILRAKGNSESTFKFEQFIEQLIEPTHDFQN